MNRAQYPRPRTTGVQWRNERESEKERQRAQQPRSEKIRAFINQSRASSMGHIDGLLRFSHSHKHREICPLARSILRRILGPHHDCRPVRFALLYFTFRCDLLASPAIVLPRENSDSFRAILLSLSLFLLPSPSCLLSVHFPRGTKGRDPGERRLVNMIPESDTRKPLIIRARVNGIRTEPSRAVPSRLAKWKIFARLSVQTGQRDSEKERGRGKEIYRDETGRRLAGNSPEARSEVAEAKALSSDGRDMRTDLLREIAAIRRRPAIAIL